MNNNTNSSNNNNNINSTAQPVFIGPSQSNSASGASVNLQQQHQQQPQREAHQATGRGQGGLQAGRGSHDRQNINSAPPWALPPPQTAAVPISSKRSLQHHQVWARNIWNKIQLQLYTNESPIFYKYLSAVVHYTGLVPALAADLPADLKEELREECETANRDDTSKRPWICDLASGETRHLRQRPIPSPQHLRTLLATEFDELFLKWATRYPAEAVQALLGVLTGTSYHWLDSDTEYLPVLTASSPPPDLRAIYLGIGVGYRDHQANLIRDNELASTFTVDQSSDCAMAKYYKRLPNSSDLVSIAYDRPQVPVAYLGQGEQQEYRLKRLNIQDKTQGNSSRNSSRSSSLASRGSKGSRVSSLGADTNNPIVTGSGQEADKDKNKNKRNKGEQRGWERGKSKENTGKGTGSNSREGRETGRSRTEGGTGGRNTGKGEGDKRSSIEEDMKG